jgi:micrococcal nuclease
MRQNRSGRPPFSSLTCSLLLTLAVACGSGTPASQVNRSAGVPRIDPYIEATIVKVIDGDSIIARIPDGRNEDIRLIGVDAPDSGQRFTGHASTYTHRLLPIGRVVILEQGPVSFDAKNRFLAYLWLERPTNPQVQASEKMLNALLLTHGLAHIETGDQELQTLNPRYDKLFRRLEETARRAGLGIWS